MQEKNWTSGILKNDEQCQVVLQQKAFASELINEQMIGWDYFCFESTTKFAIAFNIVKRCRRGWRVFPDEFRFCTIQLSQFTHHSLEHLKSWAKVNVKESVVFKIEACWLRSSSKKASTRRRGCFIQRLNERSSFKEDSVNHETHSFYGLIVTPPDHFFWCWKTKRHGERSIGLLKIHVVH